MGKADDDATIPRSMCALEPTSPLQPFPVEALNLPDEALVRTLWLWWLRHTAEMNGISQEGLTQEIADAIGIATLHVETDNVANVALEKILRSIAGGAPGHEAKTAELIRAHFWREAEHIAALDEAKTGRRRQRANSRKPRPDGLQSIILEIVKNKPTITQRELITQLRRYPTGGDAILDDINDAGETIDWHDKHNPGASTPFSALKDRMSRARKKITSR